jgi:hypothetical protein
VAQVIEGLLSKQWVLSSNPGTIKKKRLKKEAALESDAPAQPQPASCGNLCSSKLLCISVSLLENVGVIIHRA